MKKEIKLNHVYYMPKELEAGILYVSKEFEIAGHLCPCGCGNKVMTPIGPTDWSFTEVSGKSTLYPSIGNWQLPCKSHYWIISGEIQWSNQWTDKQIKASRKAENKRVKSYFHELALKHKPKSNLPRFVKLILRK